MKINDFVLQQMRHVLHTHSRRRLGKSTKSFHAQKKHPKYCIRRRFDLYFYFFCMRRRNHEAFQRYDNIRRRSMKKKMGIINILRSKARIFRCVHSHARVCVRPSTTLQLIRFLWLHRRARFRNPLENLQFPLSSLMARPKLLLLNSIHAPRAEHRTHTVELVHTALC